VTADPRVEAVAEALRRRYRADEPFTPAALAPIAVAALDAYDGPKFSSVVHGCCERAEQAEAAIARVRALCDEADRAAAMPDEPVVIYTDEVRAALDGGDDRG